MVARLICPLFYLKRSEQWTIQPLLTVALLCLREHGSKYFSTTFLHGLWRCWKIQVKYKQFKSKVNPWISQVRFSDSKYSPLWTGLFACVSTLTPSKQMAKGVRESRSIDSDIVHAARCPSSSQMSPLTVIATCPLHECKKPTAGKYGITCFP